MLKRPLIRFLCKKYELNTDAEATGYCYMTALVPTQSPTDPQENDYATPLSVDLAKEVKYKAEAAV